MHLLQEFVIFFLTMMSIFISCESKYSNCQIVLQISLQNLRNAERSYIKKVCRKACEGRLQENINLKPIEGIMLPVGNTTDEIQASVCAINDYLENHLPHIVRNLHSNYTDITRNLKVFMNQLKGVATQHLKIDKSCDREIPAQDGYSMKEYGLRIIYFTKKWTQSFLSTELCSQ